MADEVAALFRDALRLDKNFPIEDQMSFNDIPGWDSVGHMNLVTQLESRLGINLDLDEIVALDRVGAVRELIARKRPA